MQDTVLNMSLPNGAGLSLKAEHVDDILNLAQTGCQSHDNINDIDDNPVSWFECHPENYFGAGGEPHFFLERIAEHFPLSMHGVSLSLASSEGLCEKHLQTLKALFDRYKPAQISEHLAWSHLDGHYLNDLLPIPYTKESFSVVRDNILHTQDFLGRSILIENPSLYLQFNHTTLKESDFLNHLCQETECGILLDINNISVSSFNNVDHSANNQQSTAEDIDANKKDAEKDSKKNQHIRLATKYLDEIDYQYVREIHLAGHTLMPLIGPEKQRNIKSRNYPERSIRIDDHGSEVSSEVWSLFNYALKKANKAIPTLVEWDSNIPDFSVFLEEAKKTLHYLNQV